jgi:nucleotide-binding universal stress UspA family protein
MYEKILAPLDGSELSECSLQHIKAVAIGCQVPEVILIRVTEPVSSLVYSGYPEMIDGNLISRLEEQSRDQAKNYIEKIAVRLKREGINVKTTVVSGSPADEILDYVKNNKIDLIIMSTHGKSGISRFAFGSVAEKVLRHSTVPVLVISAAGCRVDL